MFKIQNALFSISKSLYLFFIQVKFLQEQQIIHKIIKLYGYWNKISD